MPQHVGTSTSKRVGVLRSDLRLLRALRMVGQKLLDAAVCPVFSRVLREYPGATQWDVIRVGTL